MRKVALLMALAISGCSLYPSSSEWKRCGFEVASVLFTGFRENQTEWEIALKVHNPNPDRLKMESVRLFAVQGEDTLAILHNQQPLDLSPNDTTRVLLNAELSPGAWDKALAILRRSGKCPVTVTGDAFYHGVFGVRRLPGLFKKTYDVDLEAARKAMGGNLLQGLQGLPFFR